jgi:hypothetical protein
VKWAIAIIYTFAAIAALGIGFMGLPRDPLNFIFAIGLGLPWTLLAGYVAGDAKWFGAAVIIGSLAGLRTLALAMPQPAEAQSGT